MYGEYPLQQLQTARRIVFIPWIVPDGDLSFLTTPVSKPPAPKYSKISYVIVYVFN